MEISPKVNLTSVAAAEKIIFNEVRNYGYETVTIEKSIGRVLAQPLIADRDFPPFNRVTMDGIAINYCDFENGNRTFKIQNIQTAGSPQLSLTTNNACIEVFSTGDIVRAIIASSAIPVLFEPVKYRDKVFIDGGAINCFPVEPLLDSCGFIIGNYVNPVRKTDATLDMMQVFDRGFHLALYHEIQTKQKLCHVYIEPAALQNYYMFDFKKAAEIMQIGYEETLMHSAELNRLSLRSSDNLNDVR